MARPAPVDDGSPGRLIATMVGIVGILLLGSLAWSAVGALFSAVGDAAQALAGGTPTPKLVLAVTPSPRAGVAVPSPAAGIAADVPPSASSTAGPLRASTPLTATAVSTATAVPTLAASPTPDEGGRSPWILLPRPAPGAHVQAGAQVIEARGRGDSAIAAIRLELDGAALSVSVDQRSETVWRGSSVAQLAPGHHAVRAVVVDDQGRTGSYRWTFEADP